MSWYFGAVAFCATDTGDDDGKPVGGKKKRRSIGGRKDTGGILPGTRDGCNDAGLLSAA